MARLQAAHPVAAAAAGRCDAVALWLEFEGSGGVLSTGGDAAAALLPPTTAPRASLRVRSWRASHDAEGGSTDNDEDDMAAAGGQVCSHSASMKQGLAYLDAPLWVEPGQALMLAVTPAAQEHTSLAVSLEPALEAAKASTSQAASHSSKGGGSRRAGNSGSGGDARAAAGLVVPAQGRPRYRPAPTPRHSLLPSWHYPMLADAARNGAFDAAIRCDRGGQAGSVESGARVDALSRWLG
jgi:hypothetical protein